MKLLIPEQLVVKNFLPNDVKSAFEKCLFTDNLKYAC